MQDHVGVAKALIAAGARLDARCFAGKTVVHYGAGCMATPTTLQIVALCVAAHDREAATATERLANLQDRTGMIALHECVMNQRLDLCKWHMARGASAEVKEMAGLSPLAMAHPLLIPEINAALTKGGARAMKKAAKAAKASEKKCGAVGCGATGAKLSDAMARAGQAGTATNATASAGARSSSFIVGVMKGKVLWCLGSSCPHSTKGHGELCRGTWTDCHG